MTLHRRMAPLWVWVDDNGWVILPILVVFAVLAGIVCLLPDVLK